MLGNAYGIAVGDFLGTSEPQLLARMQDRSMVLLQLSDLSMITVDTPPSDAVLPQDAVRLDSGIGVSLVECSIGCNSRILARVVDCGA